MDIRKFIQHQVNPILVINGIITRANIVTDIVMIIGGYNDVRRATIGEIERYLKIHSDGETL